MEAKDVAPLAATTDAAPTAPAPAPVSQAKPSAQPQPHTQPPPIASMPPPPHPFAHHQHHHHQQQQQQPPAGSAKLAAPMPGSGMRLSFDQMVGKPPGEHHPHQHQHPRPRPHPHQHQHHAPGPMLYAAPPPHAVAPPPGSNALGMGDLMRKKRGRPRKYAPDGSMALALAPLSSASGGAAPPPPPSQQHGFSISSRSPPSDPNAKRRGRPHGSGKKKQFEALGSWGISFTPHILSVKAGEFVLPADEATDGSAARPCSRILADKQSCPAQQSGVGGVFISSNATPVQPQSFLRAPASDANYSDEELTVETSGTGGNSEHLLKHDHLPYRSLTLPIQEVDVPPRLKLSFAKKLMLPIFTNQKLVDAAKNAIEIWLIDTRTNHRIKEMNTNQGSSTMKLEVLVLDGDFRCEDDMVWTNDQFNAAIVKARVGRRPLLVGSTLNVAMNNQGVAVIEDVVFTDNSSWIRSRKFRIGVRVMATSYYGPRIQEALSESFTVKDHRGELYKKHYPPILSDNIWRLKNIGKDGPIDKRLESEGIKNVQDFLKLHTIDPDKLKNLVGMSNRQWRTTLNHAKTCTMGGKCYVFKSEGCDVIFSPIGEILAARIGDQTCSLQQLHQEHKAQVNQLASMAYEQWDQLEEVVANEMALAAYEGLTSFPEEKPSSPCLTSFPRKSLVRHAHRRVMKA